MAIPGNSWWSGDQRVMGSLSPPRHWRMKAKPARVKERSVRSKTRRDAKDCEEEEEANDKDEEEEVGLRVERRPAMKACSAEREKAWCTYIYIYKIYMFVYIYVDIVGFFGCENE